MFINFSNHPSKKWSDDQKKAALKYGEIEDVNFPNVCPNASRQDIYKLAEEYVDLILANNPDVVMVQGEFTLCHRVINLLNEKGVIVVAACSERIVKEINNKKITEFRFEQFREY